jgi:hypothetical protein
MDVAAAGDLYADLRRIEERGLRLKMASRQHIVSLIAGWFEWGVGRNAHDPGL